MQRFNLTFNGDIQPGRDRKRVRRQFAEILGIEDAARLDACFSGAPIVLCSDLDRKTAADLYHRLDQIGAAVHLTHLHGESPADGDAPPVANALPVVNASPVEGIDSGGNAEQRRAEARRRAIALERKLAGEQKAQHRARLARGRAPIHADCPNLYALAPFRVTTALRERPARARQLARRYTAGALAALLLWLAWQVAGPALAPAPPPAGPLAAAPLEDGGLALLLPDQLLLHDRAGVGETALPLAALGLSDPRAITAGAASASHFLLARSTGAHPASEINSAEINGAEISRAETGGAETNTSGAPGLFRCHLPTAVCAPHGPQDTLPTGIAVHPASGMMLQALPTAGVLRKLDASGAVVAEVERDFRASSSSSDPSSDPGTETLSGPGPRPALLARDGLLYIGSTEGPALSILRYEDGALGRQLDEVFFMAPPALEAGFQQVHTFAANNRHWWVVLAHPASGARGLYQFDARFGFERALPLPAGFVPEQLMTWGGKLLVLDPNRSALQRFGADGQPEAPLQSDLLDALTNERNGALARHAAISTGLNTLLWLLVIGCAALAALHGLRQQAFVADSLRGAEPVDYTASAANWVAKPPQRQARLRRLARLYLSASCLLLVLAVLAHISPASLAALTLLLGGPALALWLYLRSPTGHIAVLEGKLLLVDHRNVYHTGRDGRIFYRGWFLMIDDVLVYTGPSYLPAFVPSALQQHIVPLVEHGQRMGRRGLLARLIEGRHPLAQTAGILLASTLGAIALAL
ncbi:hypothetical protein [Parahaliea mediterranea]|uniref:hypothetical protein n=1 Tax=Parahaliea mediterranea TaxID=651086 RepID=UPI000E2FDC86|nr:hypothetical protein [Parahaliea mediterranea]